MDLDVKRCVASVTIISGTLPARRVVRKYVFPVGRANTVQSVSVSHLYLDLIIDEIRKAKLKQQFCWHCLLLHFVSYYNRQNEMKISTRDVNNRLNLNINLSRKAPLETAHSSPQLHFIHFG
jgi:hypothetical protein